jgi:hypothetical protein
MRAAMPSRKLVRRRVTIAVCAAAMPLIGALAVPPGQAQALNCSWYATTALKQQQQNEQRKCGFKGPEWSSNRQAHAAWCASQAPDRWKKEAQRREQLLATCKR